MVESYDLVDLWKAISMRPMGWPVFTRGDLHLARGEKRLARAWFRDRMRRRYFTASDTLSWAAGSTATWTSAGGSGFGGGITCTSLASAATRQGAKSTTTILAPPNGGTNAVPPDFFAVQLTMQYTSAPTNGDEVPVQFGFSNSSVAGTSNPGGMTGTDAAGTNVDVIPQLTPAGYLVASNSIGTGVQFQSPAACVNPDPQHAPFMSPQIYNKSASATFDATAAHTTLTVIPYWRQRAA